MMFPVSFAQPVSCDMRIYLRGGYIGVSKHGLNGAKISPSRQQMAREGMPENMRRDIVRNSRLQRPITNPVP